MPRIFQAIIIVYLAGNCMVARMLYKWLKLFMPRLSAGVIAGAACLLLLSAVFSLYRVNGSFGQVLSRVGSCCLGIFMYLFLALLLAGLVMLCWRIFAGRLPDKVRLYATLAAVVLSFSYSAWGFFNAAQVRVTPYTVSVNGLAEGSGLRVALISDLHLGAVGSERKLKKLVSELKELSPDLVCLAGDIFDNDFTRISDPDSAIEAFRSIPSIYGVFACLGNHDVGATQKDMLRFLDEAGIRLLTDEGISVDGSIYLIGRRDSRRGNLSAVLAEAAQTKLPVVVMDHNPAHIGEYGPEVSLILCGHTHKGQLFPFSLITRRVYEVDYGYYCKPDGGQVIVSSGAGYWGPPMRTGTPCEIALITLKGK